MATNTPKFSPCEGQRIIVITHMHDASELETTVLKVSKTGVIYTEIHGVAIRFGYDGKSRPVVKGGRAGDYEIKEVVIPPLLPYLTPDDIVVNLGSWSNWGGYELRVTHLRTKKRASISGASSVWLRDRAGAKYVPSMGKVQEYLRTTEGRQYVYAVMRYQSDNSVMCSHMEVGEYFGLVPREDANGK